jgi:hypothetical protein
MTLAWPVTTQVRQGIRRTHGCGLAADAGTPRRPSRRHPRQNVGKPASIGRHRWVGGAPAAPLPSPAAADPGGRENGRMIANGHGTR